jgi:hypothetical protein
MEVHIVYMELLSGHEKIITKSGISLNVGTLNRGFTVFYYLTSNQKSSFSLQPHKLNNFLFLFFEMSIRVEYMFISF